MIHQVHVTRKSRGRCSEMKVHPPEMWYKFRIVLECEGVGVPSGKLSHSYGTWTMEIADLPIQHGDFSSQTVTDY